MQLTQPQTIIASDTTRFRVVNCGRRFGKTVLAIEEMLAEALFKEAKIAYVAPTYQQARDIAWEQLKKRVQPVVLSINESRLEIRIKNTKETESIIVLRGWESIDTLRGQAFDFIVLDEVASMRYFWEKWEEVIRPTLTDRIGKGMFISTPKGFNHFYELYSKQDPNFKSFHFTTYDNPTIPKEEIDVARTQMTEDRFAQEYLADFRKVEGLVYKEFDRTKHVIDKLPLNIIEKYAGIDFGYTNPTAIVTIGKTNDGVYVVMDEWYKTGKTNSEVIEYARTLNVTAYYPDPAEPDRIMEMQRTGLNVREVNKDVKLGIDSVRNLLKNRQLYIHSSCKNLIWEIENYQYKDKKAGSNEPEEPIKENDHLLDAIRYVLFMQQPSRPLDRQRQIDNAMNRMRLSTNENY